MDKTVILPIIALLAIVSQTIAGVEIKDELQNDIVNGILALVTLYGIYKNHKKEGK